MLVGPIYNSEFQHGICHRPLCTMEMKLNSSPFSPDLIFLLLDFLPQQIGSLPHCSLGVSLHSSHLSPACPQQSPHPQNCSSKISHLCCSSLSWLPVPHLACRKPYRSLPNLDCYVNLHQYTLHTSQNELRRSVRDAPVFNIYLLSVSVFFNLLGKTFFQVKGAIEGGAGEERKALCWYHTCWYPKVDCKLFVGRQDL